MNRLSPLIYFAVLPVLVLTVLFALGATHLWYGLPYAWVMGCVPILSINGGCGIVIDWSLFSLDVLFYTAIGYALMVGYYRGHGLQARAPPQSSLSDPSRESGSHTNPNVARIREKS